MSNCAKKSQHGRRRYLQLRGWQTSDRQVSYVVFDQGVIYRLELGEFDSDAPGWGYVTDYAFGVERMLAAYFYAHVGADGKFGDGCEHAAYAKIAEASGDAIQPIAITYGYGTIFFSAVKVAL